MAIHPEVVLGYTPIIIILTTQILDDLTRRSQISKDTIEKRIASILGNKDDPKALVISKHLMKYKNEKDLPQVNTMDERIVQQAKIISREIVEKEFPEEEEYFDFLFDLTIQEIEEVEPGKEAEFLKQMR